MSDLEDLPDSDSQRYGRRWRKIKLEGIMSRDLPIVEQHYGIDTCGLDVTFDPSVACFFATHKFHQRDDGTAYYKVVEDDDHCGVLYGFVFRDPKLTKTSELVESLPLFDHIQPTRPQRQKCALPFFHSHSINEAVCDLDFVMYISKGFDISGLPSAQELFPGVSDDEFYRAALEIKAELNNGGIYEQFIEYKL
jgi:FRG domain-containing protein